MAAGCSNIKDIPYFENLEALCFGRYLKSTSGGILHAMLFVNYAYVNRVKHILLLTVSAFQFNGVGRVIMKFIY